ncbi:hypothetical protein B0H11DRAFT_2015982 [Mycena galericulata]|nr:hypothetical protein B0H11DRAFT_2015982 [Mycena galericulata]
MAQAPSCLVGDGILRSASFLLESWWGRWVRNCLVMGFNSYEPYKTIPICYIFFTAGPLTIHVSTVLEKEQWGIASYLISVGSFTVALFPFLFPSLFSSFLVFP